MNLYNKTTSRTKLGKLLPPMVNLWGAMYFGEEVCILMWYSKNG